MKTQAFVVFGAVLGLVVGCGGSADSSTQAPAPAATDNPPADQPPADPVAPPLDHGSPSETYPAFKPEIGQLVNNGGHVMKSPVIVTVTWSGETNADTFEKFADELGPSDYWKAVTSEYGVGPATSGATNHIRMTDTPPSTLSDSDIPNIVAQKIQATDGTAWPQPTTDDYLYILYIPNATTFKLQGKEVCSQGVGGYHDSTKVGGKEVAYAVIPQCGGLDESTLSASHELAEAATDPHPQSLPGYVGFDEDHLSWEFFQQFQSENGDACEFYRDSSLAEPTLGFTVQRQWSNAAAAAGHNPCVPSATGVKYFNVSPLKQEDIELDLSQLGGDVQPTKGYKIKVGETKQIPLGLYSDGPTGPWQISAQSGGMFGHSSGSVDLTLDIEQGQNGQIAYLTATVNTQGRTKAELITIVSKSGSQTHYQPILIGSPDK